MLALPGGVLNSTGPMIRRGYSRANATQSPADVMSDKHINYKFPGAPPTPQIGPLSPIVEEKGEKGSKSSFAERVNALTQHDRQAISKYLPKEIEGLSAKKQHEILEEAICRNDPEAVEILAECGVDLNREGSQGSYTPLTRSCEYGHVRVVEALLIKGANPNILTRGGHQWGPLHWCGPLGKRFDAKSKKYLECAKLLLNHGADVNLKTVIDKITPLHLVDCEKQPEFVTLLLSHGADPLARNMEGKRPRLQLQHFKALGPHLTEALQQGNRQQVDRWITVVEKFLPDPKAASLLVEWAPLCSLDAELSKRIHTIISRYLKEPKGDPPGDVVDYAKSYNAEFALNEILAEFAEDGFRPAGMGKDFHIEGARYSAEKHGRLLIRLASSWAESEEDHMGHVMGILNFAKNSAKDQQASQDTRDKLFLAVKRLRNRLKKRADPEIAKRAKAIDSFLNPFNGPH